MTIPKINYDFYDWALKNNHAGKILTQNIWEEYLKYKGVKE